MAMSLAERKFCEGKKPQPKKERTCDRSSDEFMELNKQFVQFKQDFK